MAHDVSHLMQSTPKGVKINLGALYVYEDGHANLTFQDAKGVDWPMNDPFEVVSILVNDLLRPMQKRAQKEQRGKRAAAKAVQTKREAGTLQSAAAKAWKTRYANDARAESEPSASE